ncbi:unnamed protein product [Rhizophagus irregularis]|nr:unnamed protein product [Rhizophagus irregularis]
MEQSETILPYEIKVVGEDKKCLKSTLKNSTDSTTFEKLNSSLMPKIYTLTLAESKRSMAESSILDGPDINNNKMVSSLEKFQPNYVQLKNDIQDLERNLDGRNLVGQTDVSTLTDTSISSNATMIQRVF